MTDLILVLVSDISKRHQRIILRTLSGTIKILKSGVLSAIMKPTDVFENVEFSNYDFEATEKIRKALKESVEIQKGYFSLSKETFSYLKDMLLKNGIFYLDKLKRKNTSAWAYYPIKNIEIYDSEIFRLERNGENLSIHLSSDNFEQNKNDLAIRVLEPVAELYCKSKGLYELIFRYGNAAINSFSTDDIVEDFDSKYMRNRYFESNAVKFLASYGFTKEKERQFSYKGKMLITDVFESIIDKGIKIFDTSKAEIHSSKGFSSNISYGIDWFDINFLRDGQRINPKLLAGINLNARFFEYDGKKYILPSIFEEFGKSIKTNNGLKIEKKDWLKALSFSDKTQSNLQLSNLFENKTTAVAFSSAQNRVLRQYQKDGVKWLLSMKYNGFSALLADDMGLGKTLQAITLLQMAKQNALIIAPKSLLMNWSDEIKKFAPELETCIYHGSQRKKLIFKTNSIIITTYATILSDIVFLQKQQFDTVIFDEVQTIKNYKSKMYEAANLLSSNFRLALSGTPFENNILELWAIMKLLNPSIFSNRKFFTDNVKANNLVLIRKAVAPFMLRRTKNEVLTELPEKTEITLICSMDSTQSELYSALHTKIIDEIKRLPDKFEIKSSALILDSLLKLRQFCCHPKLLPKGLLHINLETSAKFEVLKEKIFALTEQKEKILVFSQFTSMLKIINEWLVENSIKTFYLDGQSSERHKIVSDFEKSNDGVFLISLKAGCVGLNLVSCHYVIIYDPWWNPATENQASDRVYRIGQQKQVFIYRLITKDTIEEKVEELKSKKKEIAQNLFSGLSSEKFSIDDFMTILK